ncbi:hypothetical protein C8T65DRAFT_749993 [Cerioporus squamosus]|nr:hypothetical protein C8T65DRAFT_749993 [Cerioporus squamosus]
MASTTSDLPTLVNLPQYSLPPDLKQTLYDASTKEPTLSDIMRYEEWTLLDTGDEVKSHQSRPLLFVLYGTVTKTNLYDLTSPTISILPTLSDDVLAARTIFDNDDNSADHRTSVAASVIFPQTRPINPRPLENRGPAINILDSTNPNSPPSTDDLSTPPPNYPLLHPATILPGDIVRLLCTLVRRHRSTHHINIHNIRLLSAAPDDAVPDLIHYVLQTKKK